MVDHPEYHHIAECTGACTNCHQTLSDGRVIRTCNSGMNWALMRQKDIREGLISDIPLEVVQKQMEKERREMEKALKNA